MILNVFVIFVVERFKKFNSFGLSRVVLGVGNIKTNRIWFLFFGFGSLVEEIDKIMNFVII